MTKTTTSPAVSFFDEYGALPEIVRKPATRIILQKAPDSGVATMPHRICSIRNPA